MTCPHLRDGRCALAELLAARELGATLECPTTEATCARCQKRGQATEEKPLLPCLGNATAVVPQSHLPQWSAFCSWIVNGKSRGLGDTIAKTARMVGLEKLTKAVKAVTGTDCGCGRRQRALNAKLPYSDSQNSADLNTEKSERAGP